ncbi:unnamed protein product [Cladocopium goreaui]|uniref:Endonuclease/exonuclease/phosphatase domain-containing protein n=1 Tax=Cladocopium goreaui TaxID=2562237 RepID=A0A9P1DR19_9DINO|nr:unnamed protein product [Cladocopium goreaui]
MDEDSFASPAKTFERIFGDGRLRVVSYNVCGFGAGFKENVDTEEVTRVYGRLRKDLSDLKADIICLNEVKRISVKDPEGNDRDDTLEALAEDLEEMEYFFAHANPGYESFGNAILVSRKLQVCVAASLEDADKKFAVLATHLDHISEAERLRQAESILSHRARLSNGLPHLLVGDLNAMKRSDYSEEEWAALEARNSRNRWSPPEDSAALVALEAAGYRDMHQTASEARWTLAADPPARIDYILASNDFGRIGRINEAFVASAVGSDHLPMVLDILLKET